MLRPKITLLITLFSILIFTAKAQNIDTLLFRAIKVIPHNTVFSNELIEELSGIEYTGFGNKYYVIPQSRVEAHVFLCSIDINPNGISVEFDSVIYFDHGPLEAESIRVYAKKNQLYIAEEGDGISHIYKLNKNSKLDTVYTSTMPQRHNRGYEGLAFNSNGTKMFIGLERPKKGNVTQIISYDLEDGTEIIYEYKLDELPLDKEKDNGITELLMINDSTLLVVERAYLGPKYGVSIRVYKTIIHTKTTSITKIKLLTDFSASPEIDNIEGVTYSASGKELIFISDNNGNSHQQTLFICMNIQ